MFDPHTYSITIRRGVFEDEPCYEATIREFPDLAEYADSAKEAYDLAIDALITIAEAYGEKGRQMPAPQIPAV